MARQKGLVCSENNFWVAIRNPVYRGEIFIAPYKDETGYLANGPHEPLISEAQFDKVQATLDGRRRNIENRPKVVAPDNPPLRGFLACPRCH